MTLDSFHSEDGPSQSRGTGWQIRWQNGPVDGEQNGAQVEDIIRAAMDRLDFFQGGRLPNDYNASACDHLAMALDMLDKRTADRKKRGVEGTLKE